MMPSEYGHPELLADVSWLFKQLTNPQIRIVDMGNYEGYARAHIPGAVHFGANTSTFIKDSHNPVRVMPQKPFAELMAQLGIGDDTMVVIYDTNGGNPATRLWWALDHYGHQSTKILNGGWDCWLAQGYPISQIVPSPQKASFTPRPNNNSLCLLDELKEYIGKQDVVLLDVRTSEEFSGTESRGNKRSGHVPGAVHLEWTYAVANGDDKTFKPADDLHHLLERSGITPDKLVVTY